MLVFHISRREGNTSLYPYKCWIKTALTKNVKAWIRIQEGEFAGLGGNLRDNCKSATGISISAATPNCDGSPLRSNRRIHAKKHDRRKLGTIMRSLDERTRDGCKGTPLLTRRMEAGSHSPFDLGNSSDAQLAWENAPLHIREDCITGRLADPPGDQSWH